MPRMPSRLPPLFLLLALWTLSSGTRADAAGIAVIVAYDAPRLHLDRATLRDIYLKKIFVDEHGTALIPVNLPPDDLLRRAFSLNLFRETADELQSYWNERYFHGVRPPYVLGSPNAVVRFVARTSGAIGYVATCQVDASVRRVLVLPVPASEREAVDRLCDGARHHDHS